MRARVFVGVVSLAVSLVAGCTPTGQTAVPGVLPDGSVYTLTGAGSVEPVPDGLIAIDTAELRQVIGEHTYARAGDGGASPGPHAVVLRTDAWTLEIDLYPEVRSVLDQNGWSVEDLLGLREVRGLPVLAPLPPLGFAHGDEAPRRIEVAYGPLAVRRGCDEARAVACSEGGRLQVVATRPGTTAEVRIEDR